MCACRVNFYSGLLPTIAPLMAPRSCHLRTSPLQHRSHRHHTQVQAAVVYSHVLFSGSLFVRPGCSVFLGLLVTIMHIHIDDTRTARRLCPSTLETFPHDTLFTVLSLYPFNDKIPSTTMESTTTATAAALTAAEVVRVACGSFFYSLFRSHFRPLSAVSVRRQRNHLFNCLLCYKTLSI